MSRTRELSAVGRAIVTYGRGWQSLAATRSLGKRGVEVVTGDEYPLTPASFSKYSIADFRYPDPTSDPGGFLDVLEKVIHRFRPPDPATPYVLMPIHKETYLIARHRDRFEPHIRVPLPEISRISQVHNKGTLAVWARDRGLPIPSTWCLTSLEELEERRSEIPLPAFVKLRESAAGVGIQKVDTAEGLVKVFRDFVEQYRLRPGDFPIIQEAVPGEDYCVTTLFDRGRLVVAMTYHNLRQFPADKGAGVLRETVEAPEMESVAEELLGPLDWHGVAQLDFRWTGERGEPARLIEVNPRFWGGLNQAIASGWDYPWLLYRLAVDGQVDPPPKGRHDVRTEAPIFGLIATLREISQNDDRLARLKEAWGEARVEYRDGSRRRSLRQRLSGLHHFVDVRGRVREARRQLELHRRNVYDVLSLSDPRPMLGVFYPLAIFLKHGKLNMELLTSEFGPGPAEAEGEGEDGDTAEGGPR